MNRFWKHSLLYSKILGIQWLYSALFLKLLLFFFEMYNIITSVPLSFSSLQTLPYIFSFIVSNSLIFFTYWCYMCVHTLHMHHIPKYINIVLSLYNVSCVCFHDWPFDIWWSVAMIFPWETIFPVLSIP